jgi:anthranilate synthase
MKLEFNNLTIVGKKPVCTLEVKNNQLFKDGKAIGKALDIFKYLKLDKNNNNNFFPAWIGFFGYEFSNYFLNKDFSKPSIGFPDAFFKLFDDGIFQNYITPSNASYTNKSLEISSPITKEQFFEQIKQVKKNIIAGDVYQVNLSIPFYFDADDELIKDLYNTIKIFNPSPYMGLISHDDWSILSASPEKLFSLKNNKLITRPIAGTKKRDANNSEIENLKNCKKENAEHVMLVDLLRNDLNQVCLANSVEVSEDRSIEFYSHVMHLVSEVSGTSKADLQSIFKALFPSGTITGAPKLSAIDNINNLEPIARGPYTGSLGYISSNPDYGCEFDILIRSVYKKGNKAWFNAGAGIVIDSDPESEWAEVHKKAQAITDILQNKNKPYLPKEIIKGPGIKNSCKNNYQAKVAFLENNDSFSFNIVAALKSLGANVELVSDIKEIDKTFSHVLIGPGPGNPTSMPNLQQVIKKSLGNNLPILGICLGHQALGHFFGATITKAPLPIHGQNQAIKHNSQGLFIESPKDLCFTRYHSLVIEQAPADFIIDAVSIDNLIMAIRHKNKPIFGLQFHPESYLSLEGNLLLENFLKTKYE